jgi:pimeloyl-ACP methyl ester carboxylesterase
MDLIRSSTMPRVHSIWALLLVLATAPELAAAQASAPATGDERGAVKPGPAAARAYMIFLRGAPVGREDVTVQRDASGTTVTGQGRLSAPFNAVTKLVEFKYGPDWTTQSFALEGTINGGPVSIQTSFAGGTASTNGSEGGKSVTVAHQVAAQTIVLPNGVFSAYAALSERLASVSAGDELRAYILPHVEIPVRVAGVYPEQMQIGNTLVDVRRYDLVFANPGSDLAATLISTSDGGLIRLNVAAQGLDLVRDDLAASTSRTQVHSNPGDEPVTIPATGFNLGVTMTRPRSGPARLPAVILVTSASVGDRDGFALGVPVLGQLAGALADAGFLTVRFDKRGSGQSGGRAESATISDFAEDVRAVFRWLERRKDVDRDRIAVVGYDEGGWIALAAAAREKDVAAVVTIAAPSAEGAVTTLERQQITLERSNLTPEERARRIALQKQIHTAVLTGKGWEEVPPELRRQADTPWFQSVLSFDPAETLEDVRQPLLFVHGEVDKELPASHADRLGEIARRESDSKSVDVVLVRGMNHLMLPATTGEVTEYASLRDATVSPDAATAIAGWLTKTFAAIR